MHRRLAWAALVAVAAAGLGAAAPYAMQGAAAPLPDQAAVSGILHRPDEAVNPGDLASLRHVVLWRRGPTTGREFVGSKDPRYRRTERLRVEHAASAAGAPTARMLDAFGKPMAVPVQVSERRDSSSTFRWLIAEAVLAPLAPGGYAIELRLDDAKVITAFKVVP